MHQKWTNNPFPPSSLQRGRESSQAPQGGEAGRKCTLVLRTAPSLRVGTRTRMLNLVIITNFTSRHPRRRSQLIGKNIHKARLLVVPPPHHSCPRHWCRNLWQQIRSRACVLQTMRAHTRACTYKHDKHTYRHTHTSAVTPTHVSAHTRPRGRPVGNAGVGPWDAR